MCGRFALDATEEAILRHFGLTQGFNMASRFNIAPSSVIPIVRGEPPSLEFVKWGFVPSWSKDNNPSGHINARAETAGEKPSFKAAAKSSRCLIPATGYFEWKTIHNKKQPFYITVQENPLIAFAGIWNRWSSPEHEVIETAAILTVEAEGTVANVHERMPLIVDPSDYYNWLDQKFSYDQILSIIKEKSFQYTIHPVSPRVNNPRFDSPACLQPLS